MRKFLPLVLGLSLGLFSCATGPRLINGMAVEGRCDSLITETGSTTKINLPSAKGYGFTFDLGAVQNEHDRAQISRSVGAINEAIVLCCKQKSEAALTNDRVKYDKYDRQQAANIHKLQQISEVLAGGEKDTKVKAPRKPAVKKLIAAYSPDQAISESRMNAAALTGMMTNGGAADTAAATAQRAKAGAADTRLRPEATARQAAASTPQLSNDALKELAIPVKSDSAFGISNH